MLSFFARLGWAVLLAVVATLAACGGGGEGESPPPTVTFQSLTALGGVKVRLTFSPTDGFSQAVLAGDEIVWHSGMVSGTQPTAPRAVVIKGADGTLSAEMVLDYTTDRGIFGIAPKGQALPMEKGQPANAMVVTAWQLPLAMKAVPLADGTGRTWLDVKF